MTTWGARPARDLIVYMQATMPPGRPSLAESDYINVTAFILQSNGAAPGAQPLVAATATQIGAIATGQHAAVGPTRAGPQGAPQTVRPPGPPPPRGLSVTGEVKNYVPVTDAMSILSGRPITSARLKRWSRQPLRAASLAR